MRISFVSGLAFASAFAVAPVRAEPYKKPPKAVLDVLHAPLPPSAFPSPTRELMILATPVRYPPIAELAEPMLRLAGVRVTPRNNGVHDTLYYSDYTLVPLSPGTGTTREQRIAVPKGARLSAPQWAADGKRFAFTNITSDSIELWAGEISAAGPRVHKVPGVKLNPVLQDELQWMPDQKTLLVKLIPVKRGPAPSPTAAPEGPRTLEAAGKSGAISTYEARDVLKSQHDAELFEYYAAAQPALVDAASGHISPLGPPALYTKLSPAPGGEYLRAELVHRPFSFLTGYERFPTEVELWDKRGKRVHTVASLPLADNVPIWGVRTGPRNFLWRPTEPATLIWAEALDGGDWDVKVPHRDRLKRLAAPFTGEPETLWELEQRFTSLLFRDNDGLALLTENDYIRHWTRTFAVDVDHPATAPRTVWDRSSDDRYKHPGWPLFRMLPNGFWVMAREGNSIFLSGQGASPEGDRPFLDRLELGTLESERLFHCDKNAFEYVVAWMNAPGREVLTRRESPSEAPNYFVRTLGGQDLRAVTHYSDPTPELRAIQKRLVKYKRADGLELSFTLYLPPGYKEGTRLPTVIWAYPLDYADAQVAGQVDGSTQRFTILGWPLQLFFLLDGYAVVDNPALPVVGDTKKIYDTYMEQLISGAKAAVDKVVELGVADPERIGITGHSHGALMTANLLAHTDLFRAGIARSGAYNRTLTAFGFQNERRSVWQAPEVYNKVSTFFSADKLKSPILLIHGEADVNPGTVPLQSERFYEALRGTGGTVRLVMLPFESHLYHAMETTEDVLAESLEWFDRYVKNAPPRRAVK